MSNQPALRMSRSARGLVNLLPRSLHALRGARTGSSMHVARGLPIRARTEPFLPNWKPVSLRARALVSIVPLVLFRLILGFLLSREMPKGNHAPSVSGCLLGWVMRCWERGKQFDISMFGIVNAQHAVQCFAYARDVLAKVRSWSIHISVLASRPWRRLSSGPEHTRQAQCYTTSTPHHLLQLSIEYYFSHPTQVWRERKPQLCPGTGEPCVASPFPALRRSSRLKCLHLQILNLCRCGPLRLRLVSFSLAARSDGVNLFSSWMISAAVVRPDPAVVEVRARMLVAVGKGREMPYHFLT